MTIYHCQWHLNCALDCDFLFELKPTSQEGKDQITQKVENDVGASVACQDYRLLRGLLNS